MEDRFERVEQTLDRIEKRLARIEGRENQLRGAWWVIAGIAALIGALGVAIVEHL